MFIITAKHHIVRNGRATTQQVLQNFLQHFLHVSKFSFHICSLSNASSAVKHSWSVLIPASIYCFAVSPRNPGAWPSTGFPELMGCGNLFHYLFIINQYARKIHHLAQVFYFIALQQFFNLFSIQCCTGSFKSCCRHTTRRTKIEFKRHLFAIVNHVFNARQSTNICYFMRVTYGGNCAMHHRQTCKFTGISILLSICT